MRGRELASLHVEKTNEQREMGKGIHKEMELKSVDGLEEKRSQLRREPNK